MGRLGTRNGECLRVASKRRRTHGSAVSALLLILLLASGVLGLNYVRNYRVDQQEQKSKRPYADYPVSDLEMLASGYRMELAAAEKRHVGRRIETRVRHHFSDRVQEFERVQREARTLRKRALDVVQIRRDLDAIEAEQHHRTDAAGRLLAHLERLFRL